MDKAAGEICLNAEQAHAALRQVPFPGFSRDIVSFGFVRNVAVEDDDVVVHFAPNTKDAGKVETMKHGILDVLYGAGFAHVDIQIQPPFDDESMFLDGGGTINPLQAEMREDALDPTPDILRDDLRHAALTPESGDEGPASTPFDGPRGPDDPAYDGSLPVLQWDIDPEDPAAASVETAVVMEDWEFRVWWQTHPCGDLVYASLRAIRDDWVRHGGDAREHPVGRMEAVNLVYDRRRGGVLAIYGTVRDFRPFVAAFHQAYTAETGEE